MLRLETQKINELLVMLNEDRNILFNEISTVSNIHKEQKIKVLESIQKNLIQYKTIMCKEAKTKELI
jgi:hypothetical protein